MPLRLLLARARPPPGLPLRRFAMARPCPRLRVVGCLGRRRVGARSVMLDAAAARCCLLLPAGSCCLLLFSLLLLLLLLAAVVYLLRAAICLLRLTWLLTRLLLTCCFLPATSAPD